MSYSASAALQAAIFATLGSDPALVGVAIVDALPPGGGSGTFVLIGPEDVVDRSDRSGSGAEHRLLVSVISSASGFLAAKSIAASVSDCLVGAKPPLSSGRIVAIDFVKAAARRLEDGDVRRVDLTFRVRVES